MKNDLPERHMWSRADEGSSSKRIGELGIQGDREL